MQIKIGIIGEYIKRMGEVAQAVSYMRQRTRETDACAIAVYSSAGDQNLVKLVVAGAARVGIKTLMLGDPRLECDIWDRECDLILDFDRRDDWILYSAFPTTQFMYLGSVVNIQGQLAAWPGWPKLPKNIKSPVDTQKEVDELFPKDALNDRYEATHKL